MPYDRRRCPSESDHDTHAPPAERALTRVHTSIILRMCVRVIPRQRGRALRIVIFIGGRCAIGDGSSLGTPADNNKTQKQQLKNSKQPKQADPELPSNLVLSNRVIARARASHHPCTSRKGTLAAAIPTHICVEPSTPSEP